MFLQKRHKGIELTDQFPIHLHRHPFGKAIGLERQPSHKNKTQFGKRVGLNIG